MTSQVWSDQTVTNKGMVMYHSYQHLSMITDDAKSSYTYIFILQTYLLQRELLRSNKRPMGLDAVLENQLGHWQKFQKLHIHFLSTKWGQYWGVQIFAQGSSFWDTGRCSKLPYLAMKLGHWPKFQKLNIYSLPTPVGRNWVYFHSMGSSFRDAGGFSKLPYFAMKLGIGQTSRSWTYTRFLPHWFEIEFIFTLWAAVSEMRADFQNCHIWAWNLAINWQKFQKLNIYSLPTPVGRN